MAEQPKPAVRAAKHDTVPTLFADGLFGASVTSGVVRLELFADHRLELGCGRVARGS